MPQDFENNRSTSQAMPDRSAECPSENELVARVAGSLSAERVAAVDTHIDECQSCRMVLAEAARGNDEIGLRSVALATFSPNESVAGRYLVKRRLAAGGMGEVYEAHDNWLDEPVAIKTVVPTIADNELALARLKAEMRLARRVTHRNVCRVYDLGFHRREREQIAFLTMELVRGTTLRRRLDEKGPFDVQTAAPLVEQMVTALAHAHAEGVVHRDFKPDNVMLVQSDNGSHDRVVVMDFGLARMALVADTQPLTPNSHTVLGTLDYMSPEQVQSKHAGPASDIYSLGVVLFEMLTGRLPFERDTPLARALLRVTGGAPSLAERLPNVDPAWSRCVARCLERKPEARFESVTDILEALPFVRPVTRTKRARRSQRLGIVAGAALGASVAVFASSVGREPSASSATPVQPLAVKAPDPVSMAQARAVSREGSGETPPEAPPVVRPPDIPPAAPLAVAAKPSAIAKKTRSLDDPAPASPKSPTNADAPTQPEPAVAPTDAARTSDEGAATAIIEDGQRKAPASRDALLNPFRAAP